MDNEIIPGRYYRKYECQQGHTWHIINAGPKKYSSKRKKCRECKTNADVIDHRPLKKSDIPCNKRMYGKFACSKPKGCGNEWSSANAWKGYKQGCLKCNEDVLSWDLYFLRRNKDNDGAKLHQVRLCEKCKELGHSCVSFYKH
jgi:hypothetical protein